MEEEEQKERCWGDEYEQSTLYTYI
jgi:hypothetical protein